jgi:hypothetical protein
MKTYSETCGLARFNWGEFLTRINYTVDEWQDAHIRTLSAQTDAVGNLSDQIKRLFDGRADDLILRALNADFKTYIKAAFEHWKRNEVTDARIVMHEARSVLFAIETRSAFLLGERLPTDEHPDELP